MVWNAILPPRAGASSNFFKFLNFLYVTILNDHITFNSIIIYFVVFSDYILWLHWYTVTLFWQTPALQVGTLLSTEPVEPVLRTVANIRDDLLRDRPSVAMRY